MRVPFCAGAGRGARICAAMLTYGPAITTGKHQVERCKRQLCQLMHERQLLCWGQL